MRADSRFIFAAVLALATLLAALQFLGLAPSVASAGTELVSVHVDGALPATDPESGLWSKGVPLDVPVSAQVVVAPTLSSPTVTSLEVRSLANGTHIAFRIAWADSTKDNRTTLSTQFRDAVAIQIGASGDLPYLCMGGASVRMNILHWKADWQADIEEGFRDLEDALPNFWVDYYPFAIGEPPYEVPKDFAGTAGEYLVGYAVGNPFSQPLKVTPVEDAVAYGFFTITTQARQDAVGRGVWSDGGWAVVISRRLDTGDPLDNAIGRNNALAFAVWDGANGDRGSRKSTSTWVPLRLETPSFPDPIIILVIILVATPVIVVLVRRAERSESPRKPGEKER